MHTRRTVLTHSAAVVGLLAACGLFPRSANAAAAASAWDATTVEGVLRSLGAVGLPEESTKVQIAAPDIADNGAVVPVTMATTETGVQSLAILVAKNPSTLAAVFHLSDAVEPTLATRIKMDQTSDVYAVALLADGRVLFARKEVSVTVGGCGG